MGGPFNHNKGGNSSNSNSNRGRPYGLMLVLVFGAALVGVMVLHKLRERRIFNLVIKEKDTELVSLHLALQKERDYSREVKMKHEDLKAKMYSIRTQKMRLERTVVEMKSTIGSLKEELRTMEAAFEEKQNETKMPLRGNGDQSDNPRVMKLVESLKQKEAEIEDLKHRLEYKVWSVSTDDPSNPTRNLTMSRRRDEADQVSSEDGNGSKSMNFKQGETTKEVEGQVGKAEGETYRMEMMAKKSEKMGNSQEVNLKGGNGGGNTTDEGQAKKSRDFKDVDHKAIDGQEIKGRPNGNLEEIENSELGDGQKFHVKTERGMKLEMQDEGSENKGRSRVGGKQGYNSGIKGKKWRSVAKNWRMEKKGNSRNNGVASMGGRRFFEDDRYKGRAEEVSSNRRLSSNDRTMQARESADSSDAEDLKNKLTHVDSTEGNGSVNGIASNDIKQKQEFEKSEDHEAISIQQNLNNKDISNLEDSIDVDTQDFPGDLEVADAEEHERDVPEDGFFGESGSNVEDKRV
ncbi:hypothetical protein RchiOBHm_Chr2g0162021 [Rosa chinensis]|uniref:Micronuclear linker histone polyprotein n=2 Tax=Rosa chinensis TaxID=74649 RepID=A0A2P6S2W8_ROSCH|nr:hypothetical protein RchiOBHm_Chr2g0162021 [Rosa chinensis]